MYDRLCVSWREYMVNVLWFIYGPHLFCLELQHFFYAGKNKALLIYTWDVDCSICLLSIYLVKCYVCRGVCCQRTVCTCTNYEESSNLHATLTERADSQSVIRPWHQLHVHVGFMHSLQLWSWFIIFLEKFTSVWYKFTCFVDMVWVEAKLII